MKRFLAQLRKANAAYTREYPGESGERQPVHTVYGGAHMFKSDTAQRLGASALKTLLEYAPNYAAFGVAIGLEGDDHLQRAVYTRVMKKLKYEPVEDFRIDFEDGYGNRPDEEEDRHTVQAAEETAKGLKAGTLPPFIGIRLKPLSGELYRRSLRTLDLFVSTLAARAGGRLPDPFYVTLPKITHPEQVSVLAKLLKMLESKGRLKPGSLKIELMIETTQSVLNPDGTSALLGLVRAAGGRCIGAHFGTYDYTAALGITAAHQHMTHPACDFARHVMQVSLAGTGIRLSDGGTNILPVPPHADDPGGSSTVHRAWKLHVQHIQHSLEHGFYQGWDLHPAQLPTRYAAVYAFFLEGLKPASARLKAFVDKAAQVTLLGDIFDDAATGQGLLNYFLRGLNCGAITEEEAKATGLSLDELKSRSFVKILEGRKPK